ncbi:MAG: hypothetical protein Fues2KO_47210 [Fuerstiella sp.]
MTDVYGFGETEARRIAEATQRVLGHRHEDGFDVHAAAHLPLGSIVVDIIEDGVAGAKVDAKQIRLEDETFIRNVTVRIPGAVTASAEEPVRAVAIPIGKTGFVAVLAGESSGSGSSSCGSCCDSVDTGDMLHPHLPSGSDETTRTWSVAAGCGDAIAPISIPNTGGTGRTVWSGGLPEVDYDSSDHKFRYTIPQGNLTVFNNAGADVTSDGGVTRSGSVVMDWSTTPPQISVTLDSTIS